MKLLRNIAMALLLTIGTVNAGYSGKSSSSSSSSSNRAPSVTKTAPAPDRKPSSVFNTQKSPQQTPSNTTASGSIWGKKADPAKPAVSSSGASTALQQKQVMSPPKPKTEYVNDFKQKNANVYVNHFTTEPTVRPSYIPTSYSNGGHTYNISYNSGYGGYGYMDHLGTWIMFDALSHAAANSYVRDVAYYNNQPPVIVTHTSGGGFITFLFVGLIFFLVAFIFFRVITYIVS